MSVGEGWSERRGSLGPSAAVLVPSVVRPCALGAPGARGAPMAPVEALERITFPQERSLPPGCLVRAFRTPARVLTGRAGARCAEGGGR
ncbi:hypothetical protein SHIRM173S_11892 [Streptomyces hirsutus]